MTIFKFRIDTHDIEKFQDYFEQRDIAYLVGIENNKQGTNPHSHFYLDGDIKSDTLRKFTREQGFTGNRGYSLGVLKGTNNQLQYLGYVQKEGNFMFHNIPRELIEAGVFAYENSKLPLWQRIWRAHEYDIKMTCKGKGTKKFWSHQRVMEDIIKYHVDNKLLIRRSTVTCIYETIMVQLGMMSAREFIPKTYN